MTQPDAGCSGELEPDKLPRRDWILLPLLSLLTICFMIGSTELIARQEFPHPKSTLNSCLVKSDPSMPVQGVPNSICTEESFETGRVEYKFNECGDRAGMACGPKPAGTYRIVMTGSSVAFGSHVDREKTFAALLPAELSRLTGRKVELYNEGMLLRFPRGVSLRFNEVLAAKPDLILWVMANRDIESPSQLDFDAPARTDAGLKSNVINFVKSSRTRTMLQYYLYRSPDSSMKLSLMGIESPEYLKANPSAAMQRNLQAFDSYAGTIAARAKAAGVPLVVALVPGRTQAAMISMGRWPPDCDPYKLRDEVRSIIESHGATYIDIFPGFRSVPNAEQHYFPLDGHPDAEGNALVAQFLAGALTNGQVPALLAMSNDSTHSKQGR